MEPNSIKLKLLSSKRQGQVTPSTRCSVSSGAISATLTSVTTQRLDSQSGSSSCSGFDGNTNSAMVQAAGSALGYSATGRAPDSFLLRQLLYRSKILLPYECPAPRRAYVACVKFSVQATRRTPCNCRRAVALRNARRHGVAK